MIGMMDWGVYEHPLRASHASPSFCEGEEVVLVWPAGGWQVFDFLVGVGMPPLSFGHFPRERAKSGHTAP